MAFVLSKKVIEALKTDQLVPRKLAIELDASKKIITSQELVAYRQAEQIVGDAQNQADAILAAAQRAYEAECERGYEDGLAEIRMEQAEKMIEHVSRTVDYFSKIEGQMVDLVMQAIQKIIADYDEHERVLIVVRNVLSVARNQKQMTLRVCPTQIDIVKTALNDLLALYPGVGYLDVVPDSRLKNDACILESEIGLVEASIDGQIQTLRMAFERIFGERD